MDKLNRIQFLMEYSLKGQNNFRDEEVIEKVPNEFPSFDEYKKEQTNEADEEPVELDDQGNPISLPPDESSDDDLPEELPDETGDDFGDAGGTDSTDAIKATFSGQETPTEDQPDLGQDSMQANIEPEPQTMTPDTEEYFQKLEDKMETINRQLDNINSFLPKPETAEDKIVKRLDAIDQKMEQITAKDNKWIDNLKQTPFNISLKDYYMDNEEDEEKPEEFIINKTDIDNYDPNKIKQSLGLQ